MLKISNKILSIAVATLSWSTLVSANQDDLNNNHKVPVRFIYSQGFASCEALFLDPIAKFESLVAEGNRNQQEYQYVAEYYHYCFDKGYFAHSKDQTAHLKRAHFGSLKDKNFKYKETNVQASAEQLVKTLTIEARTLQTLGYKMPMQIYIAGHSFGGWTVMRIAHKMLNNKLLKVNALLTIDPISVVNCQSTNFIVRNAAGTVGPRSWTQGCLEAPRDLEKISPDLVKITGGRWANIYETTMPYVRSGPIKGAPYNFELKWSTYYDYWTGHMTIIRDPRVWPGFFSIVAKNLNESKL